METGIVVGYARQEYYGMHVAHCIGGWGLMGVCKWVCASGCVHVNHDCVRLW